VNASGEIFAGVWFTGNNGPWGWDWRADDPKFPHHGTDEAHPFSLIGKIGSGPYFLVGEALDNHVAFGLYLLDSPDAGAVEFITDNKDTLGPVEGCHKMKSPPGSEYFLEVDQLFGSDPWTVFAEYRP
jgi:hypothetical protein